MQTSLLHTRCGGNSRTGPPDFLPVRRCTEKIYTIFSRLPRVGFQWHLRHFSLSASRQFSSLSSSGTFGADTRSSSLESERE